MSSTAWRGQPALVNGDGAAWRGRRLRRRTRRRGGSLRSIPSSSLALNWTSVAAESAASSPCVPPPLSQAFSPSAALARDAGQRWRVVAVLGWPAGAERIRFGEVVGDLLWERDSGICFVRSGARCCRSCSRTAAAAASSGRAASTWSFDGMQKFFVHFHGLKDRRALKLAVGFGSTNLFHSATVQQFNGAFVVFLSGLRTHMGVDLCVILELPASSAVKEEVQPTIF